ncbi:MAG: acyl carrier protein [Candidatus Thorarchaeota archaeon]
MMSQLDKFNEYICEVFGVEPDEFSDDSTPDDIDSWDSVTHMDLMALFEDEWDLALDVEEITEMTTIGLMKEALKNHGVKV